MDYVVIEYAGARLEAPAFLEPLWPHSLFLEDWPTFCGAGSGLGDFMVPDRIESALVPPACFIHDIDWAIADGSKKAFHAANNRFRKNLKEMVSAQIIDDGEWMRACNWCEIYFGVVDSKYIGWPNYEPTGQDPFTNPVVTEKLRRLAMVAWQMPQPGEPLV